MLTAGSLSAIVDGIDLPETGSFPLLAGVEGTDRNTAFEGMRRPGEAFRHELESRFIFFEAAVDNSGTYPAECFRSFGSDTAVLRGGDEGHRLPHERSQ
ncbi:MAG: hypothetical protein LBD18_02355 [Treponema sp.]|nr:hypothetical protein [Treponema sp.]